MHAWCTVRAKRRDENADCHTVSAQLKIKPGRYGSSNLKEITLICLNFFWQKELKSFIRNEDIAVKKEVEINSLAHATIELNGNRARIQITHLPIQNLYVLVCYTTLSLLQQIFLSFNINQTSKLTILNIQQSSLLQTRLCFTCVNLAAPHNTLPERKPKRN